MSAIENSALFLAFDSQSTSRLFDRSVPNIAVATPSSATTTTTQQQQQQNQQQNQHSSAALNWTTDASLSTLDATNATAAVHESTMAELRQLRKFLDDTDWMFNDVVHLAALDHPAASDAAAVSAPIAKPSQKRVGGR
jgi:hypothetical protein